MNTKKLNQKDMEVLIHKFPEEFIGLSPEQQQISLQTYRLLAKGEPLSPEQIGAALNLSVEAVKDTLCQTGGVYYDKSDRIIGYLGLNPKNEMAFRFEVEGQRMFTWCAWDSLFIPELLGQTAHVESICPVTKETIQLTVTPSRVTEVNPTSAVMSYVETEADNLRADIIKSFCHKVLFFSSADAGSQWIKNQEGTYSLLSIEDAFRLGQVKNQIQYKEVFQDLQRFV